MQRRTIILTMIILFSVGCMGCAGDRGNTKQRARAMEDLGISYARQGNLRAGLEKLLEAAKLDPDNANVYYSIARIYMDLGEYELSLTYFKKTLSLKPRFPKAQNDLGHLYSVMGKWDLAIESLKKATEDILYKTPQFAYNNLGVVYYRKGEYDKAIASYKEALRLFPSYSTCYANLGLAYEAVKDWAAAEHAYLQAVSFSPEYATAHFYLGKLYVKLNRKEEAAKELEEALRLNPRGAFAEEAKELLNTLGM